VDRLQAEWYRTRAAHVEVKCKHEDHINTLMQARTRDLVLFPITETSTDARRLQFRRITHRAFKVGGTGRPNQRVPSYLEAVPQQLVDIIDGLKPAGMLSSTMRSLKGKLQGDSDVLRRVTTAEDPILFSRSERGVPLYGHTGDDTIEMMADSQPWGAESVSGDPASGQEEATNSKGLGDAGGGRALEREKVAVRRILRKRSRTEAAHSVPSSRGGSAPPA